MEFTTSDLQTTVLKNACGFDLIGQFKLENDEFYSDVTGRSGVQNLRCISQNSVGVFGPKNYFFKPTFYEAVVGF